MDDIVMDCIGLINESPWNRYLMLYSGLKCVILLQYLNNPHLFITQKKLIPFQFMLEISGAGESVFSGLIHPVIAGHYGSGWYKVNCSGNFIQQRRRIMINPNGRRSGNERRSGNDRRLTFNVNLTNTCFLERRNFNDRRTQLNRRKGFVPVNQWRSVFLGIEIENNVSNKGMSEFKPE